MEPITYYTRDGEHFGVLALTLDELRVLRDALDALMARRVAAVDFGVFDIRDEVLAGIERMEGRTSGL